MGIWLQQDIRYCPYLQWRRNFKCVAVSFTKSGSFFCQIFDLFLKRWSNKYTLKLSHRNTFEGRIYTVEFGSKSQVDSSKVRRLGILTGFEVSDVCANCVVIRKAVRGSSCFEIVDTDTVEPNLSPVIKIPLHHDVVQSHWIIPIGESVAVNCPGFRIDMARPKVYFKSNISLP